MTQTSKSTGGAAAGRLTIVTGGQTGVDRAAMDAAMAADVPVTGWCPRGRRAEDGPLDRLYPLRETPSGDYAQRTAWNVRDSDATLVLRQGPTAGGTALTVERCTTTGKPVLEVELTADVDVREAAAWVRGRGVRLLNVAGPRESEVPGIYAAARAYLSRLLQQLLSER